jgi:flagellar biosynthesis protein FlhB
MEGKNGQTERATAKRRDDEREKGNVAISQEAISVMVLIAGVLGIRYSLPIYAGEMSRMMRYSVATMLSVTDWNGAWVQEQYWHGLGAVVARCAPLFLAVVLAGTLSCMVQTGPYFSWKAFRAGGLKALNPVKGAKKLFSLHSVTKLLMTMWKIILVGGISYLFWRSRWNTVLQLSSFELESSLRWLGLNLYYSVLFIVILAVTIAAVDTVVVFRRYERGIMMTKEEVKDEYKQYNVKPEVKRAQSKKMRALTMSRLIAEVPKASVIITNPTHVSIAIQYDPETMAAPKVVAKGLRKRALRIREIAGAHGIPIVERPPLARTLYRTVPVGRMIPGDLFAGVAEVLAYLYRLGYRLKGVAGADAGPRSAVPGSKTHEVNS